MGEFGLWSAVTAKGSALFASAIAFVGLLRFCKWLLEFVAARIDIGSTHLGRRIEHLETELAATRTALMLMINRTAERDGDDPVLQDVARILATIAPAPTMSLEDLIDQLGAIPGKGQANEPAA